ELFDLDFDGDGNVDVTEGPNGEPIISEVPVGAPGDRDLQPGSITALQTIQGQLTATVLQAEVFGETGSELTGDCSGMAMSYDSDGQMVDWAVGIGSNEGGGPDGQLIDMYPADDVGKRAFTKDNPFLVKSRVVYAGALPREGDGARDHNWSISTAGISLDSGGDDNPDGNNRNAGEVNIDDIPGGSFVLPSGIFPVSGELTSANGLTCDGNGYVQFDTGSPILSIAGITGGVAAIAGVLGLLFNSRPAITWRAGG
ncbi:MAG: hypothetical protein AAGA42_22345, partial [Actinomycetota bacterium]